MYFAYEATSLLFNTPLVLFSTTLLIRLKRASCRVPKLPFIVAVVAVWWVVEYCAAVLASVDVTLYIHNLVADPCFVQPQFLRQRAAAVSSACDALRAMASNYSNAVQVSGPLEIFQK